MSRPNSFVKACGKGDEKKARKVYASDHSFLNKSVPDSHGVHVTALMLAFLKKHKSVCRWLLSLPGIDANIKTEENKTALHIAAYRNTPFDLVISLVKLSSKMTIDQKLTNNRASSGLTALDLAIKNDQRSTAIYLSWCGADCKEENRKFRNVTLQTWLDAGCQQEAPMWAVVANDIKALKLLVNMKDVTFDRPGLLSLAKLLGRQEIKCFLDENQTLKIYSNQVFCDFEITFKDRTFPCHKNFLANQSSPFRALIEDKTRKNLPMKTELLNCPNESVAESFIKFFYIGGIDRDILDWHIVSFLHLGDYYQVKELQTLVEESMIAQLCKENVKEFLIAADKYQGEKVKAAAIDFLAQNRGIWREDIEEWKPYISRELLCEIVIKTG